MAELRFILHDSGARELVLSRGSTSALSAVVSSLGQRTRRLAAGNMLICRSDYIIYIIERGYGHRPLALSAVCSRDPSRAGDRQSPLTSSKESMARSTTTKCNFCCPTQC
jgi:hypothetical protein